MKIQDLKNLLFQLRSIFFQVISKILENSNSKKSLGQYFHNQSVKSMFQILKKSLESQDIPTLSMFLP